MGKKSLGIDISDGQITGVVLEQQGKSLSLLASLGLLLPEDGDVGAYARQLCEQLNWEEGVCVCGLPLSMLSVRNLGLPFRESKKIAQALPFELEEQLLNPVDAMVVDYNLCETTDSNSLIVTFAAEKKIVSHLLDELQGVADPEIITPAIVPLAAQVVRQNHDKKNILLLHADLYSCTLVLIRGDTPLCYRRLSYSEQMLTHPPLLLENGQVMVADRKVIEQSFHLFCDSIKRSLDLFWLASHVKCQPDRVVLTGPLAAMDNLTEIVAAKLHLPAETMDILSVNRISCSDEIRAQWQRQRFDRGLSLALMGLGKKAEVNFRKDIFAKKRDFLSTRKQLISAVAAVVIVLGSVLGYLWNDYRVLLRRDQAIRAEMVTIFKQTFPNVTTVHEPYLEMQAALKTVQGPDSPAPLLASDKRILGLLADISARIPPRVVLQVSRLAVNRESVLLKGTTNTFNAVNIIKNELSASPLYKTVQIVSATADNSKKSGMIRFEMQLQLEGV
jgi:general secretion pathway protein L